jgi:dUTP pyrophosphatase
MKIKIRRIDQELPLPEYKTAGAVAFDLAARVPMTILSRGIAYVPLNVAIKIPDGYMVLLAARSSLHKRGLMMANGVGIFDQDFSGNGDEYRAALYNFSDRDVSIERGERLCQAMLKPIERSEWEEVADLEGPDRGGFGTTGVI